MDVLDELKQLRGKTLAVIEATERLMPRLRRGSPLWCEVSQTYSAASALLVSVQSAITRIEDPEPDDEPPERRTP